MLFCASRSDTVVLFIAADLWSCSPYFIKGWIDVERRGVESKFKTSVTQEGGLARDILLCVPPPVSWSTYKQEVQHQWQVSPLWHGKFIDRLWQHVMTSSWNGVKHSYTRIRERQKWECEWDREGESEYPCSKLVHIIFRLWHTLVPRGSVMQLLQGDTHVGKAKRSLH